MGYGFEVYCVRRWSLADVQNAVAAEAKLAIGSSADSYLEVMRGARHTSTFSVEGPAAIEPDDVPVELADHPATTLYAFTLLDDADAAGDVALKFARKLARELDGVIIDDQSDVLFPASFATAQRKDVPVSLVQMEWFCLASRCGDNGVDRYLDVAEEHFPAALPYSFGPTEPVRGKFSTVGRERLITAWREETQFFLHFKGTGAVTGGSFAQLKGQYWSCSLTMRAEAFADDQFRDSARRFFTGLADALPAFYADALTTEATFDGRQYWFAPEASSIRTLRSKEGWLGLPPEPRWWAWLGPDYRDWHRKLPGTTTGHGHFFEATPLPEPSDATPPLRKHLPRKLFAKPAWGPSNVYPKPLKSARTIPDVLKTT